MKLPPQLSRDAINYLASYMRANGITSDDWHEPFEGGGGGTAQPYYGITDTAEDEEGGEAEGGTTSTISPAPQSLTSIISQFAAQASASISQSAAHLAKNSFTVSDYTYGFIQAGFIEQQVQVGGAFSYNFSTTELDSEHFLSLPGDCSSMPRKGLMPGASAGAGMGVTIGIGNIDGVNGPSASLSATFKRVGIAVTWNQDYIGQPERGDVSRSGDDCVV